MPGGEGRICGRTREWVELVDQKERVVSAQVAQKPQGGRPEGGISRASRELGLTRRSIQRAQPDLRLT